MALMVRAGKVIRGKEDIMTSSSDNTTSAQTLTLRQAIEEVPETEWVDSQGELSSGREILDSCSAEDLDQSAIWCEDEQGQPQICARDSDGRAGTVLYTPAPQTGWNLESPPP